MFNISRISAELYETLSDDFKANTKLLKEMKTDLDYIYEKIRKMKQTIKARYPESIPQRSYNDEDDE